MLTLGWPQVFLWQGQICLRIWSFIWEEFVDFVEDFVEDFVAKVNKNS